MYFQTIKVIHIYHHRQKLFCCFVATPGFPAYRWPGVSFCDCSAQNVTKKCWLTLYRVNKRYLTPRRDWNSTELVSRSASCVRPSGCTAFTVASAQHSVSECVCVCMCGEDFHSKVALRYSCFCSSLIWICLLRSFRLTWRGEGLFDHYIMLNRKPEWSKDWSLRYTTWLN